MIIEYKYLFVYILDFCLICINWDFYPYFVCFYFDSFSLKFYNINDMKILKLNQYRQKDRDISLKTVFFFCKAKYKSKNE